MASITREAVAKEVHQSMGNLANSLSVQPQAGAEEGDYALSIDRALRDCSYDAIAEANTHAKIRAVVMGTSYHVLTRLYRDRAAEVTAQQGAGASGMHLSLDFGQALGSLRLHLTMARDDYEDALAAIGIELARDPSAASIAQVVHVDADDDVSKALLDFDVGLPWFREGYHEIGQ
jgi:hypothetical protein